MNIRDSLFIEVKDVASSAYNINLSKSEANSIVAKLMNDKELIQFIKNKVVDQVERFAKSRDEKLLTKIYVSSEAAVLWDVSESNLRNALNRYGRFDEYIELGLVKKSGGTWLLTHEAMTSVFGSPKYERIEDVPNNVLDDIQKKKEQIKQKKASG